MIITLLGTGTPNPSLTRMSAGYLVEIESHALLFDIGPGSFQRLLESGRRPEAITHVFLTHLHYDHCLDLSRLVLSHWDQAHGTRPELAIFGPPGTAHMVERLFGDDGAFRLDIAARVSHQASVDTFVLRGGTPPRRPPRPVVRELSPGARVAEGSWTVRSVEVPHVQPYLHSYGYRVDCPSGAFAYSGDSGKSKAFVELAHGCDVLVHMCHHVSGTAPGPEWERGAAGHLEVAEVARDAEAKTLVVSHIPTQMDESGVRERLIAEMSVIFPGRLVWGEDGLEVPVSVPELPVHRG